MVTPMKPVNRQFNVITEARAMRTIPGYERFLINGMKPKRPRGYVVKIVPPISEVQTWTDDVEGIGKSFHNVGKQRVQYSAGWYLHREDAEQGAENALQDTYLNRPDTTRKVANEVA